MTPLLSAAKKSQDRRLSRAGLAKPTAVVRVPRSAEVGVCVRWAFRHESACENASQRTSSKSHFVEALPSISQRAFSDNLTPLADRSAVLKSKILGLLPNRDDAAKRQMS